MLRWRKKRLLSFLLSVVMVLQLSMAVQAQSSADMQNGSRYGEQKTENVSAADTDELTSEEESQPEEASVSEKILEESETETQDASEESEAESEETPGVNEGESEEVLGEDETESEYIFATQEAETVTMEETTEPTTEFGMSEAVSAPETTGENYIEYGYLYYEVISEEDKTVRLVGANVEPFHEALAWDWEGKLTIPGKFTSDGIEYSVTEIGKFALSDYTYGDSPEDFSWGAYYDEWTGVGQLIQYLTIEEGIEKIDEAAFYRASKLLKVTLPDSVEEIGKYAFYAKADNRYGIGSLCINVPSGLKKIDDYAYYNVCVPGLTLSLPDGLEYVGNYAFSAANEDTQTQVLNVPASVKTIGNYAFNIPTLVTVALYNPNAQLAAYRFEENHYSYEMFGSWNSKSMVGYVPADLIEMYEIYIINSSGIVDIEFRDINEYIVVEESPVLFKYKDETITETRISAGYSKTITVDYGDSDLSAESLTWSFCLYNAQMGSAGEKLTSEQLAEYLIFTDNKDGTISIEGKGECIITVTASAVGYTDVSFNCIVLDGMTNELFFEILDGLTAEQIASYKNVSLSLGSTAQYQEIKAKAQEVTAGCSTDYEKIKAIHTWVSEYVAYDHDTYEYILDISDDGVIDYQEFRNCPIYIYDIYKNRYSVCEGYARLSEVMLRSVGISCLYVNGYASGTIYERRCGHAWNMAYDSENKKWIHFDTTFDGISTVWDDLYMAVAIDETHKLRAFDMDIEKEAEIREFRYADFENEDRLDYYVSEMVEQTYITLLLGTKGSIELLSDVSDVSMSNKNPEIVSLDDNGQVTALETGIAEIYISNDAKTEIVTVRVLGVDPIIFTQKHDEITIGTEDSVQLLYEMNGYEVTRAVTLSSSNSDVVYVDENGCIYGREAGEATVTAHMFFDTNKEVKLECSVTVVEGTRFINDDNFDYFILSEPSGTHNGTVELQRSRLGYCDEYNTNLVRKLVIPSTVTANEKTYNVIGIGDYAFSQDEEFEKVVNFVETYQLPDTLEYIGEEAFTQMTNYVNFPASLKTIGPYAFAGSAMRGGVSFPEGSQLTTIGERAFGSCSYMTSVDLSNCSQLTRIEKEAFDDAFQLQTLSLPSSLKYIGDSAFETSSQLTELELPVTDCVIGEFAFHDSGISGSLDLSGVIEIGGYAFGFCDFTEVILSDSLKVIPESAFAGLENLNKIVSASALEEYETMENVPDGTMILPDSVEELGLGAFMRCSLIKTAELGSNIRIIGQSVFGFCDSLTKLTIHSKVIESVNELGQLNGTVMVHMYKLPLRLVEKAWADEVGGFVYFSEPIYVESITLSQQEAELFVGEELALVCTVLPETAEQTVEWTSSDETVASVSDSGMVFAKAQGQAQIVASTTDGTELTASCMITVTQPIENIQLFHVDSETAEETEIADSGITLHTSNEEYQLRAVVTPETANDTSVVWSNSNNKVAELVNLGDNHYALRHIGDVTNDGTTVVRIRANDESNVEKSFVVTYARKEYTIVVDKADGSTPTEKVVKENDSFVLSKNPTRKGYTFAGWYLSEFDNRIEEESIIACDELSVEDDVSGICYIHITAKWIANGSDEKIDISELIFVQCADCEEGVYPAQAATGKVLKPKVTLKNGTTALKLNKDYIVKYGKDVDASFDNKTIGTQGAIQITAKPGSVYSGMITVYFDIYGNIAKASIGEKNAKGKLVKFASRSMADMLDGEVCLRKEDGSDAVVVICNSKELAEGDDYTIEYINNKEAGTAYVTVTGTGDYRGTKEMSFRIVGTDISKLIYTKIPSKVYTGEEIKRLYYSDGLSSDELSKTDGEITAVINKKTGQTVTLTEGEDYLLSYKNNVNAGTATVTLVGIGHYEGSKNLTYKIVARNLKGLADVYDAAEVVYAESVVYTGKANNPEVTLTLKIDEDKTITLQKNVDYTVKYKNNINHSEGVKESKRPVITISPKSKNYTGKLELKYDITKADILDVQVKEITGQKPNAKPAPTVTFNGVTLKNNKDYTLAYEYDVDDKGVGTGTVRIIGKNNFVTDSANAKEVTFNICASLISDKNVKITVKDAVYTGVAETSAPIITITKQGKPLKENIDYEVTYDSDLNVGNKKKVIITGIGEDNSFGGSKTVTYKLKAKSINKVGESGNKDIICITDYSQTSFYYTGNAVMPEVELVDTSIVIGGNPKKLKKNVDYTVTYSNNKEISTSKKKGTIVIKGKGNYKDTFTDKLYFTIVSWNLNEALSTADSNVTLQIPEYDYTSKAIKAAPVICVQQPDGSVGTLKNGTAYTVKYKNNVNVQDKASGEGAPTVIITPNAKKGLAALDDKGKAIPIASTFTIRPLDLKNATINSIKDQTFKGKAITPTTTVKVGKLTLQQKKGDIIFEYENENKKGIATLIVKPGKNGNFVGECSKTYLIK